METAKLPLETMNKVMQLLGTLPFSQVAELITEIRANVTVEETEEAEGASEEK
tara:strand:+ start:424 stop:582 length:159 start_codon:yes stop_codon:yes gene_type:complete